MNSAQISPRILLAVALLLLADCGSDSPTGTGPRAASITVATAARGNIVSNLVAIGDTVRLVATVKDEAGNVLTGRSVTWNSDIPALAAVSQSGLVTGLARNLADSLRPITVTASSERVSGSAPIIVVGAYPVGVFVVPTRASLVTSGTQDFTATVGFDFTNLGVTWSIEGCAGGPPVCGSLTNVTTGAATYVAPALVPPSTPRVTAAAVRYAGKTTAVRVPIAASSADGQIAFQSHRDNSDDIYVISPGGSVSRLTTMGRAYFPAWSPDGTKIAFTGKFSDQFFRVASIYVMNADGSSPTRLATDRTDDAFPAWSPDGTKIAFTSNRDGNFEIYVMNADGSGQLNLTHNSAADSDPTWSPDGARIAFTSNRGGDAEIFVMNADGSGATNITHNPAEDGGPAWSPDGTRIAFVSSRDGSSEIYVMNADGTGVTRLTDDAGPAADPAWSPDGTRIAFSRTLWYSEDDPNFLIYVMNADGSGVRRLTTDGWQPSWRPQPIPHVSVAVTPSSADLLVGNRQDFTATVTNDPANGGVLWTITGCAGGATVCGNLTDATTTRATYTAPATVPSNPVGIRATSVRDPSKSFTATVTVKAGGTGEQIAFYSDNNGVGQAGEIYVMNADGSGQRNLTNNPAAERSAVWSPDGSKILFVTDRDGNLEVYVMDADGSNPRNLTKSAADDDGAVWSPDGSKILFVTNRDGNREVYVMNADGSNPLNLTKNAADDDGAVWSPDGSKILFTTRRDGNVEIYVMTDHGTNSLNLTNDATNDVRPAWSPDGTKIAFLRARSVDGYTEIYVMNADGSNPRNLTNNPSPSYTFAWSPDGSKIAFTGAAVGYSIYTMRIDGSDVVRLTSMSGAPVWSPNGTKIAFAHYTGPSGLEFLQIYVMNADGSAVTQLTANNRYNSNPVWRPR